MVLNEKVLYKANYVMLICQNTHGVIQINRDLAR
jgi:hypothetical protein